jgi:uncharacterized protein YecE (DUF72 family)
MKGCAGGRAGRRELDYWAERLAATAAQGRDVYVYCNNDPEGHAVADARTLRELLGPAVVQPMHGKHP